MKVRVAASVALAAAVAAGMSACMLITPQQTSRSYTPSDGVNGSAGDVAVRNALLISADGESGTLVGAFTNSADEARTVTLQYATASGGTEEQSLRIPADGLVTLGAPSPTAAGATDERIVLDGIDAPVGGLFNVYVTVGSAGDQLQLPVLTGSLPEYSTLLPTPTPTPTRTRRSTASPEPTGSLSTDEPTALPTDSATPTPSPSE